MSATFYNAEGLDTITQNIALKLIENQTLLKLLYYQSTDALSQPNISDNIKYSMLDQEDLENTKIFFNPCPVFVDDNKIIQIRLYEYNIRPENNVIADYTFAFEIVLNRELWPLASGLVRPRAIYKEILKTLNGTDDVGGLGVLNFLKPWQYTNFSQFHNGYVLFGTTKLSG